LVWLVNNDAVVEPQTLSLLVAAMQADPRVGMCSPVIRYLEGGKVEDAGTVFDLETATELATDDLEVARRWQAQHPDKFAIFGTALLLSRALVERVGLLDEDFFAYWEDTDLSIRSNLAGFRNRTVFEANVFHAKTPPEVSETGRKPHFYYYMARNELLLLRKHLRGALRLKALLWSIRRTLRRLNRRRDDPRVMDACLAGLWDGILRRTGEYRPDRRMPQPWRGLLLRALDAWGGPGGRAAARPAAEPGRGAVDGPPPSRPAGPGDGPRTLPPSE
jgi:GT2 family glycosyltransferase